MRLLRNIWREVFYCLNMRLPRIEHILTLVHTFFSNNQYNVIGRNTQIYYKSLIINKLRGGVKIGDNCLIGRTRHRYHAGMPFYTTLLNDGFNSHIIIGDNCRINGAYIHAQDFIEIGKNCVMASGISIIDSNAHIINSFDRTKGKDKPKGIKIGNNVWIGINAVILKGTVLGNNCVISAGSVVKGSFPDNVIIQGNPAIITDRIVLTE